MSNERERLTAQEDHPPAGEMPHSGSQDVLDSQSRQVAQVNMPPDESPDDVYDEPIHTANQPVYGAGPRTTERGSFGGSWGPMAWLLGLLALAVSIGVLIFIMQGVFQSMPT